MPTHGEGPDAGVDAPDREKGGPLFRMRRDPECGTSHWGGIRGGEDTEVGGDLVGSRICAEVVECLQGWS